MTSHPPNRRRLFAAERISAPSTHARCAVGLPLASDRTGDTTKATKPRKITKTDHRGTDNSEPVKESNPQQTGCTDNGLASGWSESLAGVAMPAKSPLKSAQLGCSVPVGRAVRPHSGLLSPLSGDRRRLGAQRHCTHQVVS